MNEIKNTDNYGRPRRQRHRPKRDEEYACIGFKDLGLAPGTEVLILSGLNFELSPERVVVVWEYPTYILLDMIFAKSTYYADIPPRHILTAIPKASLLCCDVELMRLSDGTILCGEEVGIYDWI